MHGFAIRFIPEFAKQYECSYSGMFLSGALVGPLKDGELCRSEISGDPIEAIAVHISERKVHSAPGQDLVQSHSNET